MSVSPVKSNHGNINGAEKLRRIVRWMSYHRDTFLDRFTVEQIIKIYDHMDEYPGLPELADTWSKEEIEDAIAD